MKYILTLFNLRPITVREFNSGDARADLNAAMNLAAEYVAVDLPVVIWGNGRYVWSNCDGWFLANAMLSNLAVDKAINL